MTDIYTDDDFELLEVTGTDEVDGITLCGGCGFSPELEGCRCQEEGRHATVADLLAAGLATEAETVEDLHYDLLRFTRALRGTREQITDNAMRDALADVQSIVLPAVGVLEDLISPTEETT